jgi:hypothetical protein
MDAGAEDATRRNDPDVTILQLSVDDELRLVSAARLTRHLAAAKQVTVRSCPLVKWGWIATLLIAPVGAVIGVVLLTRNKIRHGVAMLVVCALWFTIGWALLGSAQHGVKMGDIERSIGSDLSGELLGDPRVDSVRCVRETESDAQCVAELFDKSGVGPIMQGVSVSIEQDTGKYVWRAGPAY